MANFPNYNPEYSASARNKPNISTLKLGDGYQFDSRFSINPNPREWKVSFNVTEEEADEIETFLEGRALDGLPFTWTPPKELRSGAWKCDEWTRDIFDLDRVRIEATFVEVFEHYNDIPLLDEIDQSIDFWISFDWERTFLSVAQTVCNQEEVPCYDYGRPIPDIWLSTLKQTTETNPGTSSVTDSAGNSYQFFIYGTFDQSSILYGQNRPILVKRDISGEIIYQKYFQGGNIPTEPAYTGFGGAGPWSYTRICLINNGSRLAIMYCSSKTANIICTDLNGGVIWATAVENDHPTGAAGCIGMEYLPYSDSIILAFNADGMSAIVYPIRASDGYMISGQSAIRFNSGYGYSSGAFATYSRMTQAPNKDTAIIIGYDGGSSFTFLLSVATDGRFQLKSGPYRFEETNGSAGLSAYAKPFWHKNNWLLFGGGSRVFIVNQYFNPIKGYYSSLGASGYIFEENGYFYAIKYGTTFDIARYNSEDLTADQNIDVYVQVQGYAATGPTFINGGLFSSLENNRAVYCGGKADTSYNFYKQSVFAIGTPIVATKKNINSSIATPTVDRNGQANTIIMSYDSQWIFESSPSSFDFEHQVTQYNISITSDFITGFTIFKPKSYDVGTALEWALAYASY